MCSVPKQDASHSKEQRERSRAKQLAPITCLRTTFKLLTETVASSTQEYLQLSSVLPHEQEGVFQTSQGSEDQLLIDKRSYKVV